MFIRLFKKILALVLPLVFFFGCTEEPAPVPAPKRASVVKKKAPVALKVKPDELKKVIPAYSYDPAGKADPFHPFLAELAAPSDEKGVEEDLVPLTELEKFALTQFRVVAVMAVGKKKVAMLEDPQGVGHSIRIGVLIGQNKGRVVNIENGVVYVEEKSRDIMGELKSNILELAIETSEGGMK
ncbi:MAG: pilus assembly protein PilP [Proteobacteria bacterium]|nr:pilus assembly protein PilP [Pseudomonadota bacterium]